jgi:hypothetical protein
VRRRSPLLLALACLLGVAAGCGPDRGARRDPGAPTTLDAASASLPLEAASPAPAPPPADWLPSDPAPPTPLGFDDFTLTPGPPVRWTDRFEARARLMPGVSPATDVRYRWFVGGREVIGWRREFLRQQEGKWRRGDRVEVEAVAEDGTGRVARTETLSALLGEEPARAERPPVPPPMDWDAIDAADRARAELRRVPAYEEAPAPDEPTAEELGRQGWYVNPVFGGVTLDPSLLPQARRGITTGPQQTVDGWTPGEPRVDGWTPGEPRVDGWSPGEPRVGRSSR